MNTNKRLYKSDEPVVAGVCGGIAEYFELDPTLIRILSVIVVLIGFGFPAFAYIIAMVVMPKRTDDYPSYIDVKASPSQAHASPSANADDAASSAAHGAASATAPNATSTTRADGGATAFATAMGDDTVAGAAGAGAAGAAFTATAPGCAYTASNPQAYDAVGPTGSSARNSQRPRHIRTGVMLGILLVSIGLLALFDTLLDASVWSLWPLVIVIAGFMTLCTPGNRGWSLVRAGHAICLITVGMVLQFWVLDIIVTAVFIHMFYYLWPVLLVVLGLSIIGNATKRSFFNLLGSLLFSSALVFGVWNFGHINEVFLFLPSFSLPEEHPPWGGFFPFN
ncbi:MAG: PspC domain-containing protein [Coriobacteriales bacterium]|jgi:phage shock protein PspC (stress-responsive transcriptional regulator)|nr:PspC domain-containing protein [Coriobacteriales bacterium]